MERRTALATAAAIAMSAVSGFFALGATTGTLTSGPPSAAPRAATSPAASPAAHHADREGAAPTVAAARGESDD